MQGAFHSCEIPYVMDNLDVFGWNITDDDRRVAELMVGYVVNFVKTGNPNGPALPQWPSYRDAARPMLLIDAQPSVANDLDRSRHELLAQLVL